MAKAPATIGIEKADPGVPSCKVCARPIDGVTMIQMVANDGEAGTPEVFCPQCFCWVRAPLEPERYYPGQFNAVRCDSCGIVAVSIGQEPHCMTCAGRGRRHTARVLGPVNFRA